MKFNGNITLNALGQSEVQNFVAERVAANPTFQAAEAGRLIYNTTTRLYYMNSGLAWVALATGGDASALQTEVDAVESAIGTAVSESGVFNAAAFTGSNIVSATSITDAINKLDAAVSGKDALAELVDVALTAPSAGQFLRFNSATGMWVNDTMVLANVTDVTVSAEEVNHLDGVISNVQVQIDAADAAAAQVAADLATETTNRTTADTNEATARANADTTLQSNIDLKVSKAGDTMSGQLAMGSNKIIGLAAPTAAGDAANKNYVDSLLAGLSWEAPVDQMVADHTVIATPLVAGDRVYNTTNFTIYTVVTGGVDAASSTFDGGELLVDGAAFFHKADETGYVFSGTALVQFTGGGQIVAGIGLAKVGNQLDVNLGAGISQLPTDEVGVDVMGTGGLFLTIDGTADSVDGAAQLAVKLDGTTITRSAAGIKVSDATIALITTAQAEIDAEEIRAVAAEGVITGNLNTEITNRTNADAAIEAKIAKGYFLYDGAAATSHIVTHNIGSQFCNVTVIDTATSEQIIPQAVVFDSATGLTVSFNVPLACKVVVMGLGV